MNCFYAKIKKNIIFSKNKLIKHDLFQDSFNHWQLSTWKDKQFSYFLSRRPFVRINLKEPQKELF